MTSHIDKIIAVGERMVGNLNAMGVSASFNDGALTLADKILDVPGLVLDTNISWIASETQVSINQKVTFTGKLFGYYNDTGEDNVDFCGIIKNAPLKLYKGETLIDTTNTDNAGEFAFEFIPTTAGSFQFKVVCEDGTNFNGCTSSIITISVGSFDGFSLEMTDGSDILSYADEQASAGSQYCTVTCQLLNGQSPVAISGVDVVFGVYKSSDDSLIGSTSTVQTDVNGQADYTYSSHGYGDVYIKAECIFVSKTYEVQDCTDYQELTSNAKQSRWSIPSAVQSSYSSNGWTYGNASSYSRMIHQTSQTNDFSVEFDIVSASSSSSPLIVYFYKNGVTPNVGVTGTSGSITVNSEQSITLTGKTLRIEYESDKITVYVDDTLIGTKSHSVGFPTALELHTGSNRTITIKNLKIKPL